MKKALSLFLVALLVFSFSVFPAYAADGDEDPLTAINNIIALWDDPYGSVFPTIVADQGYYCFDWLNSQEFKDVWTVGSGNTGSAEFRSALGGNNLLLGKQYYTGGGGSFNGPGAGRVTRKNTGSTVKIPVISYTSNTTYFNMPTTTYNTTTNNYYNQYEVNNITYNSTYNVYNVQTTENNYYITYSPTYVTVTNFNHVDKSVSTEELYYKTPDGRNSFYCLALDMEGVTYLYDVKNAEMGLEDDGKTLGLWHLDGNFYDSSNWGHSAAAPSVQFDTAGWNGSFKYYYNSMQTGTQYIEFPYNSFSSLDYASLEFRMYVAPNSIFDMTVVVCELFSAENINFWLQAKQWNTVKILYDVKNNKNTVWVNGQIVSPSSYIEGPIQVASLKLHFKPSYVRFLNLTSKPADYLLIDEVRVSNFDVPVQVPTQPFDSNMAYIYPETAEENDIVLASSLPVSSYRVGGVRQTYPLNGDVFINVDTRTITLVLGDEFSVQLNSRSFKTNINPLFLNTVLTCRHHHISLYYTAQRFAHVDALLRQVTSYVVSCDKLWRLQRHYVFDAWEMENATNPQNIRPVRRTGFFVFNRDYAAYDTLACVGNLKKAFEEGDMLSEQEILELQCNQGPNMDAVAQPSRRYLRSRKKMH